MLEDTSHSLTKVRRQEANDHIMKSLKSHSFARILKCFRLIDSGGNHRWHNGEELTTSIKLLNTVEVCTESPRDRYIAVSYPWEPSDGEDNTTGGYQLQSSDTLIGVRDIVLERIIRCAKYITQEQGGMRKSIPFWFNQLSIDQLDPHEKELGMQSMDLVYKRSAHAIGYL